MMLSDEQIKGIGLSLLPADVGFLNRFARSIEAAATRAALERAAQYIESLDNQFWFELPQVDCAEDIRALIDKQTEEKFKNV